MSSIENSNPLQYDLNSFNAKNIHHQFSSTPEGQKLAQNVRFDRYRDKEKINESKWQELLGYDVNNLHHNMLVYNIARLFIKNNNLDPKSEPFNPKEERLLLLTSIIHDYPEGFTKNGDVNFNFKTNQDTEDELIFIEPIITKAFGQPDPSTSQKVKDILTNKESKLGKAFNAIERIAYTRTALTAWKKSKKTNESISPSLIWLTSNVFATEFPHLTKLCRIYSPINNFLKTNSNLITDAFENMPITVFNNYDSPKDQKEEKDKFNHAKKCWQEWTSNPPAEMVK